MKKAYSTTAKSTVSILVLMDMSDRQQQKYCTPSITHILTVVSKHWKCFSLRWVAACIELLVADCCENDGRGCSPVLWLLYSARLNCEYKILWHFYLYEQIVLIFVKSNSDLLDILDTLFGNHLFVFRPTYYLVWRFFFFSSVLWRWGGVAGYDIETRQTMYI